jgi:hypothetical protein
MLPQIWDFFMYPEKKANKQHKRIESELTKVVIKKITVIGENPDTQPKLNFENIKKGLVFDGEPSFITKINFDNIKEDFYFNGELKQKHLFNEGVIVDVDFVQINKPDRTTFWIVRISNYQRHNLDVVRTVNDDFSNVRKRK